MQRLYNCVTFRRHDQDGYHVDFSVSDPYDDEAVKSIDNALHRALSRIFSEHLLGSSDLIRQVLRARGPTDRGSMIELILKLEPGLAEIFPDAAKNLSLLWIAVMFRYQCSAELLVRSGADVNEPVGMRFSNHNYINQETSILQALLKMYPSSWNERLVALVMDHGADLEAEDLYGWTALHCAARKSRLKEARMLLERPGVCNACINAPDVHGITPLLRAASCRSADDAVTDAMVLLLLGHGADTRVEDLQGQNVLHHLVSAPVERVNQARILIENGASLHHRSALMGQHQPLHDAVRTGKIQLVKLFLKLGANVNAPAANSMYPLHIAAECSVEKNGRDILIALLENGANIDKKTNRGHTGLHIACRAFQADYIHLLWSINADLCAEDREGNTPYSLMTTSEHLNEGLKSMLKLLALKKEACAQQRQQPPIELIKDERRIEGHPEHWDYYQYCLKQLRDAKSTSFLNSYTLFDLLTKCFCQIAEPLRSRELREKKIQRQDFEFVSEYIDMMDDAFTYGREYCCAMLEQEALIHEGFYNTMPHVIVSKVARYVLGCKLCEYMAILRAARSIADNSEANLYPPERYELRVYYIDYN